MSQVRIPTRRPLPDPREKNLGIGKPLQDYLVLVTEEIQSMNRDLSAVVRNTASGTLVYDDGVNGRLTLVFVQGVLSSAAVAASSGATMTWTDS